jgi:uncharacterized membrane protein (DUF485 family)
MKYSTKKRYKSRYRKFSILAWTTVILFVVLFILLLVLSYFNIINSVGITISGIVLFTLLITGMVLNFYMILYNDRLKRYMNNIREYRTLRDYQKALLSIESGDIKSAIKLYNNCIPNGRYKDLLYISLVHELKHGDNSIEYSEGETMKEKGCRKFAELIKKNDPNNIYLFDDV